MIVVLTSFKQSTKLSGLKYSIARWQPKQYSYPELDIFTHPYMLRDFGGDVQAFYGAVSSLFQTRLYEIEQWLEQSTDSYPSILCCWCPYSSVSRAQIKEFGTFVCHSEVLAPLLGGYGIEVFRDPDRTRLCVKAQEGLLHA